MDRRPPAGAEQIELERDSDSRERIVDDLAGSCRWPQQTSHGAACSWIPGFLLELFIWFMQPVDGTVVGRKFLYSMIIVATIDRYRCMKLRI
jgi:hypothetical protein